MDNPPHVLPFPPELPPPHQDTKAKIAFSNFVLGANDPAEAGNTSNCLEAPSTKAKKPRKKLTRAQKREKMNEKELMLSASENFILNTYIVKTHPEIRHLTREVWSLGNAAWDSLTDTDKARFVDDVKQMRAKEIARQEQMRGEEEEARRYGEIKAESSSKKTTTKAENPRKKSEKGKDAGEDCLPEKLC